jgi:hypothetical protein
MTARRFRFIHWSVFAQMVTIVVLAEAMFHAGLAGFAGKEAAAQGFP